MPALVLDRVPDDLYQQIAQLAVANQVPITEEAVRLLRQGLGNAALAPRSQVPALLEQFRRNSIAAAPGLPDSLTLLREDRCR